MIATLFVVVILDVHEVQDEVVHPDWFVLHQTKGSVASPAKQSTHLSGGVIVVNGKAKGDGLVHANRTSPVLRLIHLRIFSGTQAINPLNPRVVRLV